MENPKHYKHCRQPSGREEVSFIVYGALMFSYFGICPDGKESLILFEAVKKGMIPTVSDRLSEEERKEIVSGAIYIWDERKSPMRRWTDGRAWSNSRVVGDFLEYRESVPDPSGSSGKYCIKPYGLRKRTICLPAYGDSSLRLIAYFTCSDVKRGVLKPPSEDPLFADIVREMEENPIGHQSLQLLASMRKRKRPKSIISDLRPDKQLPGRLNVAIAPAPQWPQPLEPANTNILEHPTKEPIQNNEEARSESLTESPASSKPSEIDSSKSSTEATSLEPTKSAITSHLPSPVWRPHDMHSEDRRALNLLDAHNVLTDKIRGN